MKETRENKVKEIFKQLTPANQRYFMTILRVAETAESNVRKAAGSEHRAAAIKRMPDRGKL